MAKCNFYITAKEKSKIVLKIKEAWYAKYN